MIDATWLTFSSFISLSDAAAQLPDVRELIRQSLYVIIPMQHSLVYELDSDDTRVTESKTILLYF